MSTLTQTIKHIGKSFPTFTERGAGMTMRRYQLEPAAAVIKSIKERSGHTFVIIISRQAGKDELLANLVAFLLNATAYRETGIVYVNPTYKPQTINAIMRLESRLNANLLTKTFWKKRSDFMRMIGGAMVSYLSGDNNANVVGAVASLLLIINEAQDITPAVYDKKFAPMVASTNATRVIVGTEWTSGTLLAREEDIAIESQKRDGIKRLFKYTSDHVRKIIPHYGKFVDEEIRKHGREHPLVKTQYFCERIDQVTGMFPSRRMAMLQGDRPAAEKPEPGHTYAFVIDVAGQDEVTEELEGTTNPGRNKTTLGIIDIDLSQLATLQAPIYRNMLRLEWTGDNHVDIFSAISALADVWRPLYIVEDMTGVGEGLWGMLAKRYRAYPDGKVIGFKFTQGSKSDLGYGFLAIVDTGRFRDCASNAEIIEQYQNCKSEILVGPAKTMRWGVPDGTRSHTTDGHLIYDDYVLSDALTAQLDKLEWYIQAPTEIIEAQDPLEEMDHAY